MSEQTSTELVEINVFVHTAEGFEGHVKLSGVPAPKAASRFRDLSKALATAGFSPSQRSGSGQPSQNSGPACPEHGAGKVAPSKFGAGFYCKARTGEGYCKWKSEPQPLPVRVAS